MSQYTVAPENPNELVGGGGCLGNGDSKHEDCKGPYVIFQTVETASNQSPHAVLCYACLEEISKDVFGPQDEAVIDLPASEVVEETPTADAIPVI